MEKLYPAGDNLAQKISYYHVLFFMVSLPLDRFYSHIILISFTLHTLLNLKKGHQNKLSFLQFLMLISVFVVTVVSTLYTINSNEAFNEWGKQTTILLFPVVFWLSGFDLKKYRDSLLFGFSLVCVATVVYLYLSAFYVIRYFHLPLSELIMPAFVNHNFSQPIDMHATFLSMQLTIALMYFFYAVLKEGKWSNRLIYTICILVLFSGIVQLSSKSVFFCLLIAIDVLVPIYLLTGDKRRDFMLIAYSVTVVCLLAFVKLSSFKDRYVHDLKADLTEIKKGGQASESRLTRWAVVGQIIKEAPVIGHGAGSELDLLHEAFWKRKYYNSFLYSLNAHNEYLSFLVKSGIIGLLVYLATLISGFLIAVKRRDFFFVLFVILIAVVSLSENMLDVDKGIIFYAFFFSFFLIGGNGTLLRNESIVALSTDASAGKNLSHRQPTTAL
jgi:O-antigen ligase